MKVFKGRLSLKVDAVLLVSNLPVVESYLFTSMFKKESEVWSQEKHTGKWKQMISLYSASYISASKHANYFFVSDYNALPPQNHKLSALCNSIVFVAETASIYFLFFRDNVVE